MDEFIEREAAIDALTERNLVVHMDSVNDGLVASCHRSAQRIIANLPAADVRPVPEGGIGEMSDGYHTFNGLYYQRMVLFAALVKAYKDKAWKSYRHEDGELCFGGGWFIVGIDTPDGSYTYHYDDTVWDFFDCEELPTAKHWDGHTEKDVTRLLSLVRPVVKARWVYTNMSRLVCSNCGNPVAFALKEDGWHHGNFCPNCGACMEES